MSEPCADGNCPECQERKKNVQQNPEPTDRRSFAQKLDDLIASDRRERLEGWIADVISRGEIKIRPIALSEISDPGDAVPGDNYTRRKI